MTNYKVLRDLPPSGHKKGESIEAPNCNHCEAIIATWLALGYIEEVKEEMKDDWPNGGDAYYTVLGTGTIRFYKWYGNDDDTERKAIGNCYRTEAEAQEAKARVERAYKGI